MTGVRYNTRMCGKTSVCNITWKRVYDYASALTAPAEFPPDPEPRINISPSRQLRKSDPDSMVWETLPVIQQVNGVDQPGEAIWPFIPAYSEGRLPLNKEGQLISTANARLRSEGKPFAPTFMGAWGAQWRVIVVVSWFYEFDSRVKPQIPYAVFPLDAPVWLIAGLARETTMNDHSKKLTVTVITVDPNEVLTSVGHHRSPALLRDGAEAQAWLSGTREEARNLLRPHANESMGVEAIDMGIKIPGNQRIALPARLAEWNHREIQNS
jgi:putative SOS response-associated peptidase YedK